MTASIIPERCGWSNNIKTNSGEGLDKSPSFLYCIPMTVTYFTNNGREMKFERNTFDECVAEYQRRRHYNYGGANWGRVYIKGERIWL